jgi:hypothetical protein
VPGSDLVVGASVAAPLAGGMLSFTEPARMRIGKEKE